MYRVVRLTPMIISKFYNTAAILTLISIFFSGCAIVPNRNTITLNKTIELDIEIRSRKTSRDSDGKSIHNVRDELFGSANSSAYSSL